MRLRDYRSKALAHTIMSAWPGMDRPATEDLMGVLRDSEQLVEALATGTGVHTVSLSAVEKVWKEHVDPYWERLFATGSAMVESTE